MPDAIFNRPTRDGNDAPKSIKDAMAKMRAGDGSGLPPSSNDREKLVHNEQTKLSATLVNGLALAFLIAGIVTTATGLGSLPNSSDQAIRAVVCIVFGIALHWVGRSILGSLR